MKIPIKQNKGLQVSMNKPMALFTQNYYIFVIILYLLTFRIEYFSVGLYAGLLLFVVLFESIVQRKINNKLDILDLLVILYFIYNLVSAVQVWANGFSVEIYIKSFSNSILPIVFYYAARKDEKFFKRTLAAICMCNLIGVLLFLVKPQWYLVYCARHGYATERISSCVGSTAVGSLSVIAVVISIAAIIDSKGKKGKIAYIFSALIAVLSMQRSAWIVTAITLILMHYYAFIKWKALKKKYLLIEMLIGFATLFILRNELYRTFSVWAAQHQAVENAGMFSSRTGQWEAALSQIPLLTGQGLGTVGHKALGATEHIIADGSWAALLGETGIIGVGLFLGIIGVASYWGIKKFRNLYLPLGIIACICLQAIGSNLFEFQIIMPAFWYSVGKIKAIYKKDYIEDAGGIL